MADNDNEDSIVTRGDVNHRLNVASSEFNIKVANEGVPCEGAPYSFAWQANAVIPILRAQVEKGRYRTVRGVYYCVDRLFHNSKSFASFLDILLPKIGLQKVHLNIHPDAKGTIVASNGITFIFDKGEKDEAVISYAPSKYVMSHGVPQALPAFYKQPADEENDGVEIDLVDDVRISTLDFNATFDGEESQPEYLLVFEKEDWISELIRGGFFKKYRAIAICSKGFAQHNIYAIVKMLHNKWPTMKIIAFNDAAPSGWDIMQKFYYMTTVGSRFSVPIKMGGLFISDIVNDDKILNEMSSAEKNLERWDKTCLRRISEHPWIKNSTEANAAYHQIKLMNDHGKKWNKNKFKPANGKIMDFIVDILVNEKYISGPNAARVD